MGGYGIGWEEGMGEERRVGGRVYERGGWEVADLLARCTALSESHLAFFCVLHLHM